MNRRAFLKDSLTGMAAAVAWRPFTIQSWGGTASPPANIDVRSFLQANDPAALRLVEEVFRECVHGKVSAPTGTLQHTWITAGGGYVGQWLWDPMFVLDLLSLLPNQQQIIRDVF